LLVTCPVTSVKLQIANYFWLTANPIMVLEISLIGLAVSQKFKLLDCQAKFIQLVVGFSSSH